MSEVTTKPPFGYEMEKVPIPELLAGFEDLLAKATQLPDDEEWHWAGNYVRNSHDHNICYIEGEVPWEPGYGKRSLDHMKATAQFITAARNGMLILIDAIKALQSEVTYLQRSFCGEQEQNADLRAKLEAAERERDALAAALAKFPRKSECDECCVEFAEASAGEVCPFCDKGTLTIPPDPQAILAEHDRDVRRKALEDAAKLKEASCTSK